MSFVFGDLNLKDNKAAAPGGTMLPVGRHVVVVKTAEWKDTQAGGRMMELRLEELGGAKRSIRGWLNIFVKPRSNHAEVKARAAKAEEIGRDELKALLLHGGHPTPDAPKDIRTIVGLTVGVVVVEDEYTRDGVSKRGAKLAGFLPPKEVDPNYQSAAGSGEAGLDDEIPF